jgi:hypothetical protein
VEGERPASEDRSAGGPTTGARLPPCRRRTTRADPRRGGRRPGQVEGGHPAGADRGRVRGPAVRVAGVQAREE